MAKKRTVFVDVVVDDKGTTKKLAIDSKRLSDGLEKGQKNTKSFDRNLRGVIQTSQAGGRNFAALAQGITNGIVPAYAAFAAQVFAIGAAFRFLQSAGDLKTLEAGQIAYAGATGKALNTLTKSIQAATGNQIAFQEAAQAAAIGTAAGLTSSQLERLGGAAKDVSIVLGRDVTDSFNRLVRGVTKAEPELLDELGIVLRLKDATEEYARALGKNANDLSTYERSQAVANNVLTQAESKYGKIIDIVNPSINQFNKFGKAFDDIVNSIKRGLDSLLAPIAGFLANNPFATLLLSAPLLNGIIKTMVPGFNGLGNAASDALGGIADGLAETKRNANVKLTSLKFLAGDAEAANEFVKITNAELVELSEVSETSFRGLKTLQTGGKLAGKTIQTNLKQARLALGPFANLPKTVRLEYVRMFEDLAIAGKLSSNKVSNEFQIGFAKVRASFTSMKLRVVSGFQTIAVAAQKAANKIAGAFTKVLSGVGIATLAFDALKTAARALGIPVDALTPSLVQYSEKLSSITAETVKFVELQGELNKEFRDAGKFSLNVASNIATLSRNIDAITEGQGIEELLTFLQSPQTFAAKASTALGPLFGSAIDDLIDAQLKRIQDIRGGIQVAGLDEASIAASNYSAELGELEEILNRYKQTGFTGDSLNQEFDLKALIDAKIAYEDLGFTIDALKKAQVEADAATQDVFKNLVPDSTYDSIIDQLQVIEDANKKIAADAIKNATIVAGLDEEKVKRNTRILNLLKREQDRLNKLRDTEVKRAIFQKVVSRGQSKGTRDRVAIITKILELEDQEADILAKQRTIVDVLKEDGKELGATEEATLRNLELQLQLRRAQKDELQDSLDTVKRLNQATLDGFEQALQKNIFEALTGKEDKLRNFLLKIAQGTYEALAQQLSKILTEQILSTLNLADDNKKIKDLYLDPNTGIFTLGANKIGQAIKDNLDKFRTEVNTAAAGKAAAAEKRKFPTEADPSQQGGSLFDKIRLLLDPKKDPNNKPTITETATVFVNGNAKIVSGTDLEKYLSSDESVRTPFGLVPKKKSNTDTNTSEERNAQTQEDAAATQDGAAILQDASAQTMSNAVNTFAQSIAMGSNNVARDVGTSALMTFISAFGSAAAGTMTARYGGVMKPYSDGGIARGRNAGYPAILHGTEAVVPLPNGNSIPVEMTGSGGGVNNVSVSVNMGDGTTNVEGGEQGGVNLGKVIAGAVQEELQRQKRPGGILSPLGVA